MEHPTRPRGRTTAGEERRSDTSRDVMRLLDQRYRECTAADRVRMAASMFGTAVALAQAGFRSQHPEASERDVWAMVLKRLYAGELDETVLSALIAG